MSDAENTARLHRLLRRRHLGTDGKNGDAWAHFTEVRNGTGFARSVRSADAIAMSLWPSRGLEVHGFEIKASRSDWLRELKKPEKADEFIRYCDRWFVVTEPNVVEKGELPPTWGHLERRGSKLVAVTDAPKLDAEPITRAFLAAILRAAGRRADVSPAEIEDARKAGYEHAERNYKRRLESAEQIAEGFRTQARSFEQEAGVSLNGGWPNRTPAEVGRAVKLVLNGQHNVENLEMRFVRLAESAEAIATQARELLPTPTSREDGG